MHNLKIRVISLKNQEIRRAKMSAMLEKSSAEWSFFDAISGKDIDQYLNYYDRERRMQFPGHDLKPNEIACFLSHRAIWNECVEAGENFLILEDDAFFIRDGVEFDEVNEIVKNSAEFLNKNFLIRLSNGERKKGFREIKKVTRDEYLVRYFKDPLCTTAYLVGPTAAKKLLKNSEKFYLPVDNFIWNYGLSDCCILDLSRNFFEVPPDDVVSTIGDRKKKKIGVVAKIKREFYRAIYMLKLRESEKKVFKLIEDI